MRPRRAPEFECLRLAASLALVALTAPREAWAEDVGGIVVVRLVSVQATPSDWLEIEEKVVDVVIALDSSMVPPSIAADTWTAPGYRFDRARIRVRVALAAAARALERDATGNALRHLKDADELLDLGGLVAVMPGSLLRQYHLLAARARLSRGKGAADKAVRAYVAIRGQATADDAPLPAEAIERATRALGELQPSGLVIEVSHPNTTVYLDGRAISSGSMRRYDILPGTHYLRVIADSREAFGERLKLEPGKIVRRTVRLEKAPDALRRRGKALLEPNVSRREKRRLADLAANVGAGSVLIMTATAEGGATLRHFNVASGAFRAPVRVSPNADGIGLERLVRAALGRAPPVAAPETLIASTPEERQPIDPFTGPKVDEADPGGLDMRWIWVGAGAVVVAGVVLGIVITSGGDNEPRQAAVWLCPGREPCAP
ncbi:MAG: PEGA domain-containing protein [Myxococcota bacterium]